jgi:hypothetical protein
MALKGRTLFSKGNSSSITFLYFTVAVSIGELIQEV